MKYLPLVLLSALILLSSCLETATSTIESVSSVAEQQSNSSNDLSSNELSSYELSSNDSKNSSSSIRGNSGETTSSSQDSEGVSSDDFDGDEIESSNTESSVAESSVVEIVRDECEDVLLESNELCDLRNGDTYAFVTIGEQIWMSDNLKGHGGKECLDEIEYPGFGCHYTMTQASATPEIASGHTNQGLCPTGWHLPTNDEWQELNDFIVDNNETGSVSDHLMSNTGWGRSQTDGGEDTYGFNGTPAGWVNELGGFVNLDRVAYWLGVDGDGRTMGSLTSADFTKKYFSGGDAASVRCLKDSE